MKNRDDRPCFVCLNLYHRFWCVSHGVKLLTAPDDGTELICHYLVNNICSEIEVLGLDREHLADHGLLLFVTPAAEIMLGGGHRKSSGGGDRVILTDRADDELRHVLTAVSKSTQIT